MQSPTISSSDSDEAVGMSDEEELRRWAEYHQHAGIGEELNESYGNEFLDQLGLNEQLQSDPGS
jgi:hypothetical protein